MGSKKQLKSNKKYEKKELVYTGRPRSIKERIKKLEKVVADKAKVV